MKTIKVEEISMRLNEIKEDRRITTATLADYGKTTFQTMGQMLKGKVAKPNMIIIQNICEGLSLNEEWLLYGVGNKFEKTQPTMQINAWEQLNKSLEERIKELQYTIKLQGSLLGHNINFNEVSEIKTPIKYRKIVKLPFARTPEVRVLKFVV